MGEAKRRKDLDLGPTGEYTRGVARPGDQGDLRFAISDPDSNGNIHIDFGTEISWLAFPREQAIELAMRKAGAKKVEITL